jgi:hypothetical protein
LAEKIVLCLLQRDAEIEMLSHTFLPACFKRKTCFAWLHFTVTMMPFLHAKSKQHGPCTVYNEAPCINKSSVSFTFLVLQHGNFTAAHSWNGMVSTQLLLGWVAVVQCTEWHPC